MGAIDLINRYAISSIDKIRLTERCSASPGNMVKKGNKRAVMLRAKVSRKVVRPLALCIAPTYIAYLI